MDQQHGDEQHGTPDPSQLDSSHETPSDNPSPVTFPDDPNASLDPAITPAVPPKLDAVLTPEVIPQRPKTAGSRNAPPPPPPKAEEEDEEDNMLRMSFMDHLEELRSRIIQILAGAGISFVVCMYFAENIWTYVSAPLTFALKQTGGDIIVTGLTDAFTIKYMWIPFVASIYISAPWLVYQLWAFISPGLYPRERKWAGPFILITAGLFISGGLFAYYVAFKFALVFLLGLNGDNIKNQITIENYFDNFVTVMLGSSLLFLMPVAVFFSTLLRLTTPGFLMRHSRYAVLAIVTLAAVVTPTPDPINLAILAIPLLLLYFLGVFGSYVLVLNREGQAFPWKAFLIWTISVVVVVGGVVSLLVSRYHFHIVYKWPYLTQ